MEVQRRCRGFALAGLAGWIPGIPWCASGECFLPREVPVHTLHQRFEHVELQIFFLGGISICIRAVPLEWVRYETGSKYCVPIISTQEKFRRVPFHLHLFWEVFPNMGLTLLQLTRVDLCDMVGH